MEYNISYLVFWDVHERREETQSLEKKNIIQQQQQRMTTANKHFVLKCKTKRKQNAHFYANEKILSVILLYFFFNSVVVVIVRTLHWLFFFVFHAINKNKTKYSPSIPMAMISESVENL